jgi:hypothetical protein
VPFSKLDIAEIDNLVADRAAKLSARFLVYVVARRLREGCHIQGARNTNVHRHSSVIVVRYRRTAAYTA